MMKFRDLNDFIFAVNDYFLATFDPEERRPELWDDIQKEAEAQWESRDDPEPGDVIFEVTGR